jgi:hypothetical protein
MANAKTLEELSRADYWDERYRGDDSKDATFEWFKSFSNLESLFSKCLPKPAGAFPRILHLGCGNSVRGSVSRGKTSDGYLHS